MRKPYYRACGKRIKIVLSCSGVKNTSGANDAPLVFFTDL